MPPTSAAVMTGSVPDRAGGSPVGARRSRGYLSEMTTTEMPRVAPALADSDRAAAVEAIVAAHGAASRDRAALGVAQCARSWRGSDGDATAFRQFCVDHFAASPEDRRRLLDRLEVALEQVEGHLYEMRRNLRRWSDLVGDDMPKVDAMLATFDPAPDLAEQCYAQKLAFVALLNFEKPTLDRMLAEGRAWSPDRWAEARVAGSFSPRIPKEVADLARRISFEANDWVAHFHVPVGTMVDPQGKRWFEPDRALLTHWLVREEIKAGYNDPEGVRKQRALAWVLARTIDGSVPKAVLDRAAKEDWDPARNTIGGRPAGETMGLARYERWIDQFRLARAVDPHHPDHPTAIDRKFGLDREIPEAVGEQLLVDLLRAPVRRDLAALLRRRLNRPLEPFDVYFDDLFEKRPAEELNAAVRRLCRDERELEARLPEILRGLGFAEGDAEFLGRRVRVEIARGSGHAMRPQLGEYGAWLRTNRLKDELGWDGFDTAMHELGHNLEQLCSTFFVPRTSLRGVPNTACTEAFAFLYQGLAKRVLGLEDPAAAARAEHESTISGMLMACQIAGPGLVELRTWRWLYSQGDAATPASLREALLRISREVWAEFFAEDFGADPYHLLGAYQHMIAHPLYLPDYALGRMISQQVATAMRGKDLAAETKRICSIGLLTPDAWMRQAVGGPLSAQSLVDEATTALRAIERS